MSTQTKILPAALLLTGMLALSACGTIDAVVHKQSTATFADVDAFRADAGVEAAWIPRDAAEITVRTSTLEDATEAVILLTSESTLPSDCAEAPRTSAPSWSLDGSPSPYKAKTVYVCGEWSVIPAESGWFGWTPNSDEEKESSGALPD